MDKLLHAQNHSLFQFSKIVVGPSFLSSGTGWPNFPDVFILFRRFWNHVLTWKEANKLTKPGIAVVVIIKAHIFRHKNVTNNSIFSIKSIKLIEKSINIDFSQQIRLSVFIDFWHNQLILSIVIECYRLSSLSIAQVGPWGIVWA